MFDNVALDVVIGLVFVYLLYSLLITILSEWVSTKLGVRSRLLRVAIERMLNDGYYSKLETTEKNEPNKYFKKRQLSILGWARKVLLYEADEFKTSTAGKFYEYPAIKYLSRIEDAHKSTFNLTKPAYISSDYFAETIIDFLKDKGAGATEMEKVAFCLKFNTHHIQPKSLKQINNLFEKSGLDKKIFKENLIKWFDETMDRTNGWHKRKMQLISFCLGLIVALSFNIDTITIATKLAKDKNARDQLVQMSIQASDSTSAISKAIKNSSDTTLKKDTLLSGTIKQLNTEVKDAQHVLGLGWENVKAEKVYLLDKDWRFNYYRQLNPFRKEFWGLIITALALSLGAPFWFDLLKKLVSIRGVGINPDEKEKIKSNKKQVIDELSEESKKNEAIKKEDSLLDLFKKCKRELLNVDGVILVKDTSKNNQWEIEICTNKEVTTSQIDTIIADISENKIKINYQITRTDEQPKHFNEINVEEIIPKRGIANESKTLGFGALGCVVFNTFTKQKNFISCWHVMKGDRKFDNKFSDSLLVIDFNSNTVIGERTAGGINDELDIGIATLKPNSIYSDNEFLGLGKLSLGLFSSNDADNNLPVIFFDNISGDLLSGNIINSGCSVKVFCLDGIFRNFHDVIVISKDPSSHSTISQGGNSGSVVIHKTKNENLVKAMIFAGDKRFTYAIAMDKILSHFDELQII